jgi:hypothetical protein
VRAGETDRITLIRYGHGHRAAVHSATLSGDGDAAAMPDAELAAWVASGPGFWTDWLAELDRQSLVAYCRRTSNSGH